MEIEKLTRRIVELENELKKEKQERKIQNTRQRIEFMSAEVVDSNPYRQDFQNTNESFRDITVA